MTTNDVVGWLVWGLDEKWALCLGLFLLLPPGLSTIMINGTQTVLKWHWFFWGCSNDICSN